MSQCIAFEHRGRPFEIRIGDDGALELYLDRVLRKRREPAGAEPQYVWTNVELEWEEHHYVEARFWAGERRLRVTVNGALLLERSLPPPADRTDAAAGRLNAGGLNAGRPNAGA